MKDRALKLMTSCKHCTISSLGEDGKPQSAFVGFSEDKDFNLVIGTYRDSRKYKNISERPAVSIVVADENKRLEVQYEGNARIINPMELRERLKIHFQKLPSAEKRINDPNQAWVLIEPTWIRFVDANIAPINYEEIPLS
jgi:general stress protein 26